MAGLMGLLLGEAFAQSQGITDPAARDVARVTGLVAPAGAIGSLLTFEVARREAERTRPVAVAPGGPPVDAPSRVEVPNVANRTLDEATAMVEGVGLSVRTENVVSTEPIGRVVGQQPLAGSLVSRGSAVTVSVSGGIEVPKLVGKTTIEAERIVDANFTLVRTTTSEGTGKAGDVTAQEPEAGTFVSRGSELRITVFQPEGYAEGQPIRVEVPDVTTMTVGDARTKLMQYGLRAVEEDALSRSAVNTVIQQQPEAGQIALSSSGVTLWVNRGRKVPNVIGEPYERAKERLGTIFSVQRTDQKSGTDAPETVIAQSLAPDSMVPAESSITLTVAIANGGTTTTTQAQTAQVARLSPRTQSVVAPAPRGQTTTTPTGQQQPTDVKPEGS